MKKVVNSLVLAGQEDRQKKIDTVPDLNNANPEVQMLTRSVL
jgi:hypothetical protein